MLRILLSQVTGENGEEQLIQLTPEIQAQLFQVQQEADQAEVKGIKKYLHCILVMNVANIDVKGS